MVNSENIIQVLYPTEVADIGIKTKLAQSFLALCKESEDKSGSVLLINRLLTLQHRNRALKLSEMAAGQELPE